MVLTTLVVLGRTIADAFYARVPGAQLQNISGIGEVYTLPCDVELNVTFKFGGIDFPIHPLDTSISTLNKVDALGNPFCIGAFQPIIASAQTTTYDLILGMAFCECDRSACGVAVLTDALMKNSAKCIHACQLW